MGGQLTTSELHEVAAWMQRWLDEPVTVETKPAPRITVQCQRGRLVFDADAVRRLALTP
jgi:hypothetical protein